MNSQALSEVTSRVSRLSRQEQLWLIEFLAQGLRNRVNATLSVNDESIAAMAADPDIQREIRAIEEEFAGAESDGLEQY